MGRYGWSNRDGVKTASVQDAGYSVSTCDQCDWRTGPGVFSTIRARARRHVARELHMVTVSNNKVYRYGPEPLADG